ncbi:MAG: tetratricopeptide repeat protein [Ignavibacteria bacterium]
MNDRERAVALFLESGELAAAGDLPDAERRLRDALLIQPDFAEAHANLGLLLDRRGACDEAEASHRRAVELLPDQPRVQLNLGANLAQRKRFAEAEAAYREALRLDPDSPAAWSNLGVLYACMKREAEAERCHRRALEIDPAYANARFNLAYLLLRQGRYKEGWADLEARDWYAVLAERIPAPRWRGEDLAGKSLLITFEAGHGDMIQFCRYAPLAKGCGAARVDLICHPPLKPLFATLAGVDRLIGYDEPLPSEPYDFWTPPLSLPHYFGTRLDSIPAALPYLSADPLRAAHWEEALPREGLRVGLVWKGSRGFENDADRSLPSLDVLAPLGAVPGVSFVSLQKGAGEDEAAAPPPGLRLSNLGPQMADFADTAAIVAALDLVISVDTAVAHLAGALAKPCWLMLPDYKTDWRWLADRNNSPWYPEVMRLYRQETAGDWTPVIEALRNDLDLAARTRRP